MAFTKNITQAISNQASGRASKFVSGTLKGLTSSLKGKNGITSVNPNLGGSGTSFTPNILEYPLNVASDPFQGHWIKFTAKAYKPLKVAFTNREQNLKKVIKSASAEANAAKSSLSSDAGAGLKSSIDFSDKVSSALVSNNDGVFSGGSGKQIKDAKGESWPTDHISLYMPPSVNVSYSAGYAETEIGQMAEMGAGVIKAFLQGGMDKNTFSKAGQVLARGGEQMLKEKGLQALDMVAPGAKALAQSEMGKIVAPRMEIMFEGMGRRDFSFTFNFIPKSAQEAKVVEKIIFAFKFNMASEFIGGQRVQSMPNVFDIKYMYKNNENTYLNRISTCVLKSVNVSYGGDRYTAYNPTDAAGSPPPQKSSIQLEFSEIDILDKVKIAEGF